MTAISPDLVRRRLLAFMTTLPVLGRATALRAETFPDTATLLTAGPDGSPIDRWGQIVLAGLTRSLPAGTALKRVVVGGADGVTSANQFETRTEPDGKTALLIPGDAAIAWIVGDPRARYDVGRWIPLILGVSPALVATRGPVTPGQPLRLAGSPGGHELPAILGLELLGARVQLLPPLPAEAATAAFGKGALDAVLVCGHRPAGQMEALAGMGAIPLFALGTVNEAGERTRDPLLPGVPLLEDLPLRGETQLRSMFIASAIAAQTDFALVVRQLTSAAMVAQWRQAGADTVASLDYQTFAMSLGVRTVTGTAASALASATTADQAALLDLRRWLGTRFGWKPA